MIVRYDRPVSPSAFLARRLALFSLVMLVVVFLAHRFGPLKTPDFVALVLVAAVPAAFAVPLALIGLVRLWFVGALGGVASAWALVFAAPVLGLVGYGTFLFYQKPLLYDVSTDLNDVPAFIAEPLANQQFLPRPPMSSAMRALQTEAYPGLTGRRYDGGLDRVFEAVRTVADANRLRVVASRGEEYALPDFQPPATPAGGAEEGADLGADAGAAAQDGLPTTGPLPGARPEPPSPAELAAVSDPSLPPEPEGTIRLQLETRSLVFGLPFDAVIRLREEAEMTLIDMRVASRFGAHDLGFSDVIAEEFLRALDAELLGIAGAN